MDDGDLDTFKIGTSAIDTNTRLTIDGNGNVGIGMSVPVVLMHVWMGGTLNNVGSGDIYIQNDLEVDGTIYGDG